MEIREEKCPFVGRTVKCGASDLLGVVIHGRRLIGEVSGNVTDVINVLFTDQRKEWMLIGANSKISDPRFVFVGS